MCSEPVNPTRFLQLSQRFFFGLSVCVEEQSSNEMAATASATTSESKQ